MNTVWLLILLGTSSGGKAPVALERFDSPAACVEGLAALANSAAFLQGRLACMPASQARKSPSKD